MIDLDWKIEPMEDGVGWMYTAAGKVNGRPFGIAFFSRHPPMIPDSVQESAQLAFERAEAMGMNVDDSNLH